MHASGHGTTRTSRHVCCSPPSLLTTAACGGLRSTPDCRPRRTFLHLSYSLRIAVWTGDTRDTRPKADIRYPNLLFADRLGSCPAQSAKNEPFIRDFRLYFRGGRRQGHRRQAHCDCADAESRRSKGVRRLDRASARPDRHHRQDSRHPADAITGACCATSITGYLIGDNLFIVYA